MHMHWIILTLLPILSQIQANYLFKLFDLWRFPAQFAASAIVCL